MSASLEEAERVWMRAIELDNIGQVDEAIPLYRQAAEAGRPEAQCRLADLLTDQVLPRRTVEAIRWYKRAIRRGYPTAAWNLAMHYRLRGQRRWYVHWLSVAASMGDEDAMAALDVLPTLGVRWWDLPDVREPPAAAFGFRARILPWCRR